MQVFSSQAYIQMYQETLNKLLEFGEIRDGAECDDQKTQQVQEALETAIAVKPSSRASSTKRRPTLQKNLTIDSQLVSKGSQSGKRMKANVHIFCRKQLMRHLSIMKSNRDLMIYSIAIHTIIIAPIWGLTLLLTR